MRMRARVITLALAIAATVALSATAATPRPSTDPFQAGLAFAACMRAHGVPHPDPDRNGDFNLTPAQEHRLRKVGMAKVRAADKACFKYLKPVVSTKPLSAKAKAQARHVLGQIRTCVRRLWLQARRSRRSEPQPGPFLLRFQAERDCVAALAGVDEGGTHLRTACAAREEDFRDHRDRSRAGLADPVLADPLQADQMQDVGVRPPTQSSTCARRSPSAGRGD